MVKVLSGDQDDGDLRKSSSNPATQSPAIGTRHVEVRHNDIRLPVMAAGQGVGGRPRGDAVKTSEPDQLNQRKKTRFLIIHQKDVRGTGEPFRSD